MASSRRPRTRPGANNTLRSPANRGTRVSGLAFGGWVSWSTQSWRTWAKFAAKMLNVPISAVQSSAVRSRAAGEAPLARFELERLISYDDESLLRELRRV